MLSKPKWPEDYINKVICGDCLEVMRDMPDGCVDLVVTDPPYGFERFEGDENDYLYAIAPSFALIQRVLVAGGSCFLFSNTRDILKIGQLMPLEFYRMLWMYKPADCTYPLRGWLLTSEAIHWYTKGKPVNLQDRKPYAHDCYLHKSVGNEGVEGHPTVKPLAVVKDLVSRCPFDGIILDPFLGSGTTAVAAKQLGRKYIGIEINPDYCKIAEQRLAQTELFNPAEQPKEAQQGRLDVK